MMQYFQCMQKVLSTPDINSHLKRIYGFEVSAETVSRITDKILPIAKEWQNRPLDSVYPIIFLDGVVFNVVEDGVTRKKDRLHCLWNKYRRLQRNSWNMAW